jgi:hypothetical protein
MNLQESSIRWSVEPSPSSSHVLPPLLMPGCANA